ncbi:MerC family mercury resistance protein [Flavobacterium sp.]|jgi:hypothetical protein|uniref:MerC family mercury resistance protein n=1 Tax=Flavobacterium sp. TaxID=239 RepID=UPI0037C06F70
MKYKITKPYDVLGLSGATLCLIHCLIVPLFAIVPMSVFKSIWIDILFCSIALFTTSKILMSQSTKAVKIILGASILIVLTSVMIEIVLHTHFEGMLIGGIGLIIGHSINYKYHKQPLSH